MDYFDKTHIAYVKGRVIQKRLVGWDRLNSEVLYRPQPTIFTIQKKESSKQNANKIYLSHCKPLFKMSNSYSVHHYIRGSLSIGIESSLD